MVLLHVSDWPMWAISSTRAGVALRFQADSRCADAMASKPAAEFSVKLATRRTIGGFGHRRRRLAANRSLGPGRKPWVRLAPARM